MKLIAQHYDITMSEPVVILNRDDCLELGVGPTDRVLITGEKSAVSTIIVTDSFVEKGRIAISQYVMGKCGAESGEPVEVVYSPMPESVRSIRSKINGNELSKEEIDSIVNDIMAGNLSDKEIISFVSAFNINNSNLTEVAYLTRSMAETGQFVDLGVRPVFDFHSLGGVPGNKITPIVVSIVASEGIVIPKLSSRAVSSACGTSDYVDTFCDVEMDTETLVKTIKKHKGVFACGNEDYAPVGRKIIRAERPMGIDPRPMMMASIMSKKVSVGTTHLLVDIPMGEGSKIPDIDVAKEYAKDLIDLGSILGMHVECAVSRADQPIGRMIGPILEAKECVSILEECDGDFSVIDKACNMAGIILEMTGIKDGKTKAFEILRSGQAHKKFLEIVAAQNGNINLKSSELIPGSYVKDIHAKRTGFIQFIDNAGMIAIAKGAGAPSDLGAGIELMHKKGDFVEKGEVLFKIYADNQSKLNRAIESARSRRPMLVAEKSVQQLSDCMIIERIPSKEMLDLIRFHMN